MENCESCDVNIREAVLIIYNKGELVEFLIKHGLIERFIPCGRCNAVAKLNTNLFVHYCGKMVKEPKRKKKQCTFNVSARNGTWFSNSKLSVEDIMYFTVLWTYMRYPRQEFIIRELRCSSKTVVEWSSYCREVCVHWAIRNSKKLGGLGVVVEMDEAKFGGNQYNRGQKINGEWAFGGTERNSKNVFLVPVQNRHSEVLLEVIKEWILPGTIIISDFWKSYNALEQENFTHWKINHSLQFVDPNDPSVLIPNLKGVWRDVLGRTPRYDREEKPYIGYLGEFLFKKANKEYMLHSFLLAATNLYHRT